MNKMTFRDKVTSELLKKFPIPPEKRNPEYSFYYKDYKDNLFCGLGQAALAAYEQGSGSEIEETYNERYNKVEPPKMASIASSSAMTFNLLGNDPVIIPVAYKIPCNNERPSLEIPAGTYNIIFEKQMFTVNAGSNPANLDAFLYNEENKTAIFCEMKTLEWLSTPGVLKDAYCEESYYFDPNAFKVFKGLIESMKLSKKPDPKKEGHDLLISKYSVYDAWQMLKHTLAIYNYTSLVTRDSVNACQSSDRDMKSMAGKYDNIILLNVVNEFPLEWFADEKIKADYLARAHLERSQANDFINLMMDQNNKLQLLFKNNCNAGFGIEYMSAKKFAGLFDMADDRRDYLKRYFD